MIINTIEVGYLSARWIVMSRYEGVNLYNLGKMGRWKMLINELLNLDWWKIMVNYWERKTVWRINDKENYLDNGAVRIYYCIFFVVKFKFFNNEK
jgi:hypothetical protein